MPKTKKKEVKDIKKSDEVVIDLDSLAIPLAIIVAGLIIAGAVFLTNKGKSDTDATAGTTDTTDSADSGEEFPEATTTIGNSPYLGDIKKAKVAVVEYTDFQCPYCGRHATDTKPSIVSEYVDTGKIIYVVRNFPLDFHGDIAVQTANASLCVNEISGAKKYFEFYAQVFSIESVEQLESIAKGLGVDMGKYNVCMNEERYGEQIEQDTSDGTAAGVRGTPGFVIGVLDNDGNVEGKLISGAYPFESFKAIIDEMLEK